jgi:hypothetical protein
MGYRIAVGSLVEALAVSGGLWLHEHRFMRVTYGRE